ncbi:hypothetical protein [Streptomyces erythrochromogenes]|uniref:hypothetical protein n=1 Tax=Streptomyces erythrochromogenes TaxID=285574 RepID=UPI00381F58DA|nr:hypothetical protein OG489_34060 [Streptomyces erythrochromogenes]
MIKKAVQAALAVSAVLFSGGLAHADGDTFDETTMRDHVAALTTDIEQQNSHSAQLPAVPAAPGVPRPGQDIPIEVDFTANEDSKTAQLDVRANNR